jgi:hypothetical protein
VILQGVPPSLVGLEEVLIADCVLGLVSAPLNIDHCRSLAMDFALGQDGSYRVFSIETWVFNRFNVDPLGAFEWKLFLVSVIRLLGESATADA